MRWSALPQMVLVLSLAGACNGERAALLRGQGYYEDNQYERALSLWRSLERRQRELSPSDFARYAYLRGMTDYRLGFHAEARHWLALAKVAEQRRPGALDSTWLPRLDGALADLERESWGLPVGNADSVQSIEAPGVESPTEAPGVEPPTEAPGVEPPTEPPPVETPSGEGSGEPSTGGSSEAAPPAGESSAPAPLPSPLR
ncbi:MAG TPA: hypothetical protein VFS67_10580 [Polyangiaceae bacterium]|jgi:hypothetical protein|nr:hypothetical protein [Polyangiaceae bacterium]